MSEEDKIDINEVNKEDDVPSQQTGEFNYIVPSMSYKKSLKYRKKLRKERHRREKTEKKTNRVTEDTLSGFVFLKQPHRKRHRKHMKKSTKVLIIILSIVVGIAVITASTFLILNGIGNKQMHSLDNDNLKITPPESVENAEKDGALEVLSEDNGQTITYNGHTYKINKNIATILFMGLDQDTTEASDENADAIYLMALDTQAKTINIVSISRETMCDVDVYDEEGRYVENKNMQLCLAFGYGTDSKSRCENVVTATSRYLYNIPLSSYFAIDLTCISTLNDAIGGVNVTSNVEFVSPEDGRTISEGESVILHGEEAERYVRTRDWDGLDANDKRMQRQQQYMKAFLASVVPAAKKDVSVITDLYSTITEHSTTDLTFPKITYLSTNALSMIKDADDIKFIGIEGTTTQGKNNEFHADDKALLETVLKVFYIEVA